MRSLALALSLLTVFAGTWARAQDGDPSAVLLLAEQVNECFRNRDEACLKAHWSAASPNRSAGTSVAAKLFQDAAARIAQNTTGVPVIEGSRARVRVQRTVTGAAGSGRLTLEAVKENGQWKLWKLGSAAEELALRVANARSKEAQNALLEAEPELWNAELADALIAQGSAASNRGEDDRAQTLYDAALTTEERIGDQRLRALAQNDIGLTYYNRGDFQNALQWYGRSLTLAESMEDKRGIARALNNIGAVYSDYNEFALALQTLERSLSIAEDLKEPLAIANAIGNMAIIHAKRGDYLKALAQMQRGFEWSQRSGSARAMVTDLLNLGNVFLFQNDYDQAKYHFERALADANAADLRRLAAIAILELGQVAAFRGDSREAIEIHEKSIALLNQYNDRPNAAMATSFLAMDYAALGEYSKAIELYERSIEMQKALAGGVDLSLTYARLAAAYNGEREYESAMKAAKDALRGAEAGELKESIWRAHLEAGKANRGMRRPAEAEAELKQAIAGIEELRAGLAGAELGRQTFFEDKLDPYHTMIGHLVGLGRLEEAFSYAERAKARVLLDVLQAGRGQLSVLLSSDELRRDRDLRIRLASTNVRLTRERQKPRTDPALLQDLSKELAHLRLEYAGFQTSLNATHPHWNWKLGEVEPISPADAKALLRQGTVALEYVVADTAVFLFVASPGRQDWLHAYRIPISREKLARRVEAFRNQLAKRDLGFRTEASGLYKLLLGPAVALLRDATQVIVVPDGVLWDLPFQALLAANGSYLLDQYSLLYAPSLSALKAMNEIKQRRRQSPAAKQLLAMGNPIWDKDTQARVSAIFRGHEYGNLPHAETEVQRIASIYGSGRSEVYIRDQARESRFKNNAPYAKVVHLATHGVLNDASPLYSHLLLAAEEDPGEDGLLEAWELLQMQLNAELVVLSACDTARGRFAAGEGVIGLSWALLVGGVPTTLLSQWQVEADSTNDLMVAFHQQRTAGLSDAEAVRAAALRIRRRAQTAHPFYWAGFIVVGSGFNYN